MPSAAKLAVDKVRHCPLTLVMPDLFFSLVVLASKYLAALDRVSTVSLTNLAGSSSEDSEAEVLSPRLLRNANLYIFNTVSILTVISKILNRFTLSGIL